MISVAYVGSSVAATLLKNLGDGRIKFVGIDDDQAVLDGIRDGYVVGTMSQNPYGQAYIGAWVLDQIRQGCTVKEGAPWFIDTGTFLIDQSNLDTYQDQRVQITQDLLSTFEANYLTCPAG
jgi:ribose transport system substrate-binding protein